MVDPKLARGAVVLSGGGARGAYQAGVLRALADINRREPEVNCFRVITGVSSGAVNAAYLASQAQDFVHAAESLCNIWRNLKPEHVFCTDNLSLFANGTKILNRLMFGGLSRRKAEEQHQFSLLDTSPARKLFGTEINFDAISSHVASGYLDALAITATDYASSVGVTFVESNRTFPMWKRADRFSVEEKIQIDHVMASSAIPIFFPAVPVRERYFGDGCLRNTSPLGPAMRLGAERLVVVGVRKGFKGMPDLQQSAMEPVIGRILNTIINSVLMDAMETDIGRMQRVNEALAAIQDPAARARFPFKPIGYVYIHPNQDIGELAKTEKSKLPRSIRYLLSGLGGASETADIISYLLFEGSYCAQLIEMGYADAMAQESQILKVFTSP